MLDAADASSGSAKLRHADCVTTEILPFGKGSRVVVKIEALTGRFAPMGV
jgi:hypothetical protein